jgi:cbb3-type cytochrome oxidase subunit 3
MDDMFNYTQEHPTLSRALAAFLMISFCYMVYKYNVAKKHKKKRRNDDI